MGVSSGDDTRVDSALDLGVTSGRKGGVIVDADGYFTPRAAVVAWVGTAALIAGSFSSIMWGWPLSLGGSGYTAVPMSAIDTPTSGHSGSAATGVADKQMSGRFEVGKDGKLLRPSDAPIPSQPQLPAAAREETPEGMEAFARYVLNLVPYMWMSGNTTPLEKLALPSCSWCEHLISGQKQRNEKNAWVEKAGNEVLSISQPFLADEERRIWHVDLELKRLSMTVYDGESIHEYSDQTGPLAFEAQFIDGSWKIYEAGGNS